MSEQTTLWCQLAQDTPVTMAAKPKRFSFFSAQSGIVRLHPEGTLPEGKLILMATCETRVVHWYQAAERSQGDLLVSMAGFDGAYLSQPEENWTLELGKMTKYGITGWSLSAGRLGAYYKAKEGYFLDDRMHYQSPVLSFTMDGTPWEVVPNCANPKGLLSLQIMPKHDRYLHQLTCRLTALAVDKDALCAELCLPEGAPRPIGLCFTQGIHSTPLVPMEGNRCTLPLNALKDAAGDWQLSAVLEQDTDGTLLRLVPRVLDAETASGLLEVWGARPVADFGDKRLYLSLTSDFRPLLQLSEMLPGMQHSDCATLAAFLADRPSLSSRCTCTVLGGENWQWRLRLPGLDVSQMDECTVVLHRWRSHKDYPCPTTVEQSGENGSILSADLTPIIVTLESCLRDDFRAAIALRQGNRFWYMPLYDPAHTFYGKRFRKNNFNEQWNLYAEPVGETPYAGHPVEACPFWDPDGRAAIMLCDQVLRYYPTCTCRTEKASLRFGRLNLRVCCPKVPGRWVKLAITHRYRLETDRKEYFFPLKSIKQGKKYDTVTVSVSLAHLQYAPVYWDLRMVFEKDGKEFWISIKAPKLHQRTPAEHLKEGLYGLFFSNSMKPDRDNQLFLYRTTGNRYALVYQEKSKYSGFAFRLKERIACLIYYLNRKKLREQNIMLTYEKYCCMAQDNGFYFFQYCMENDIERQLRHKIYYIITPDSVDYENVKPYEDHVIPFMSLKHMVYLLACRLMVSSDSKPHAYAWRCKESIIQPVVERERRLVFLQHGVIALKKVEFFDASTNAVSLFVTSNRREHGIIVRELGYRPEEVIITGLTRWDVLHDRSAQVQGNHILVMPTWRNWLEDVSDEAFRQSDYYQNYMELLNSKRLGAWLEQRDAYLDFYIHPKFRDYLGNFSISGDRVRLIPFGSEPLNRLIMECKMLVTDYSSVCWDVYYQGKPCIFYQFDVEQYNEAQGAYIDLETELFGDRAVNNDELFALLEEAAAMDYQLKPKYAEMRNTSYEYLDHNNSQRVCEEIRRRNW